MVNTKPNAKVQIIYKAANVVPFEEFVAET